MHYCADCNLTLDVESGAHEPGVTPCPRCGSQRVSAVVYAQPATLKLTALQPTIKMKMNWAPHWLAIARVALIDAHNARGRSVGDASQSLVDEFRDGVVAIAAAAFAVEAEKLRALGNKNLKPQSDPPPRSWKRNAGDWLGQLLIERDAIDAQIAEDVGRLFYLRNESVHPEPELETPAPHPTGVNTSPELVAYRVEVADHLVDVAERVVAAIKTSWP